MSDSLQRRLVVDAVPTFVGGCDRRQLRALIDAERAAWAQCSQRLPSSFAGPSQSVALTTCGIGINSGRVRRSSLA